MYSEARHTLFAAASQGSASADLSTAVKVLAKDHYKYILLQNLSATALRVQVGGDTYADANAFSIPQYGFFEVPRAIKDSCLWLKGSGTHAYALLTQ